MRRTVLAATESLLATLRFEQPSASSLATSALLSVESAFCGVFLEQSAFPGTARGGGEAASSAARPCGATSKQ